MANQYNAIFNAIVRADAGQAVTELRRVDGQVQQTTTTATSKFSQFGMLAKGAMAGIGVAAVAALGQKAVNAASDLEESVNAVRVTFKDASDAVLQLGKDSVDSYGLSERGFNALAVQFAGFASKVAGPGGDVAKVIDDLTTHVADFASVMNLDLATAAQVFQSTLAGETEPIRRYGKDVSAAAVEQFALETGLIKTKKELTESIKVQARYGLLMRDTADTAGDFANTSGSLANQQRRLRAEMENLAAKIGSITVPTLSRLVGGFLDAYNAGKQFFDWANDVEVPGWLTGEDLPGGGGGDNGFNPLGFVDDIFLGSLKDGFGAFFDLWDEALTGGEPARRMEDFRDRLTFMLTPGNFDTMQWQARQAYDEVQRLEDAWREGYEQMRQSVGYEAGRVLVEHAQDISRVQRKVQELEEAWVSYRDELLGIEADSIDIAQGFDDLRKEALAALTEPQRAAERQRDALIELDRAQQRYHIAVTSNSDDQYDALLDLERAQANYEAAVYDVGIASEEAARQYEASINVQKQAVASLLDDLEGVPMTVQSEILTLIDQGQFDLAEWKIAELTRDREVAIRFNLASGAMGSAGVSQAQSLGGALFGPQWSNIPKIPSTSSGGNVTFINNINCVVGDPVSVGRQVASVLNSYRAAGGVVRY